MARDFRRLDVFHAADELAVETYRLTASFPRAERFGLASQIRRAAVSVPANLVEGAERRTQREFLRHVDVASGSAAEVRYLLSLVRRTMSHQASAARELEHRYDVLVRSLQRLRTVMRQRPAD